MKSSLKEFSEKSFIFADLTDSQSTIYGLKFKMALNLPRGRSYHRMTHITEGGRLGKSLNSFSKQGFDHDGKLQRDRAWQSLAKVSFDLLA